jgi:hypothetical protein
VARLWVDQLRLLVIVWILLTLPVVCHHETAVVILNAVAAGQEHHHMMAELSGEHPPASATHQHGAHHSHGQTAPAEDAALAATPPLPTGVPQWRAYQAPPLSEGLSPAQDGVAFFATLGVVPLASPNGPLADDDAAAPDPQRRAPPAPPPRTLLG